MGMHARNMGPRVFSTLCLAMASGCIGASSGGNGAGGALVASGDDCARDGASATANDGCNTCTCESGTWACTELACPPDDGPCTEGARRDAGDGCNECACSGGQWACTKGACYEPGSGGSDGSGGAMSGSGGASGGGGSGGGVLCVVGDSRPADDGCNTCTCIDGGMVWACTEIGCQGPNPGGACGARAGDTCGPSEYCAYEIGDLCGAADAESTCMQRPQACTLIFDPVCGCDGNSYGNACEANGAGTGVLSSGEC